MPTNNPSTSYSAMQEQAFDAKSEIADQLNVLADTSRKWIQEYPYVAIGIAATIGVTLGCLIKRQ